MLMGRMIPGSRRKSLAFSFTGGSLPSNTTVSRSTVGTRVNGSGLIESVATNTGRMNYSSSSLGARGLLLEDARTNLLERSTDLSQAVWVKNSGTIATSAVLSPDGTNAAQTFTCSAADCTLEKAVTMTTGSTYTFSVYAKRGNVDYLVVVPSATTSFQRVWFNLANGTVGTQAKTLFAHMEALPNGWYRCSVAFAGTTGNLFIHPAVPSNGSYNNSTAGNFNYVWGAQLELGGQESSLIVTAATAVQRTVDTVTTTVPNGSYDILVKTHGGGEWRNNVTVSGGSYTFSPRAGNILNLQALEFNTAGSLTPDQKDAALEGTAGTLVWESNFETSVSGAWISDLNDWYEWSFIQALDPDEGPGATYNFVGAASSFGITAKEGTRVVHFERPVVTDPFPHSKCYKEWRSSAFSKTDAFGRSEDTLSNNGDPNGIYTTWLWYPASDTITYAEWTNVLQFKVQGRDASNVQSQDPTWWLNVSRSFIWYDGGANGLPNNNEPVIFVNHWTSNFDVEPAPGTASNKAMLLPKGRWCQLRAELYELDRIDWYVDQQFLHSSPHATWPVGRMTVTPDVWIFGIGRYGGQGVMYFDKSGFRRFPT